MDGGEALAAGSRTGPDEGDGTIVIEGEREPMLIIMYAVDCDTGQWWSRVEGHATAGNRKVAVPVLDYDRIREGGDFSKPLVYHLEAMGIDALFHTDLRWTRKVPVAVKNMHRAFWGMAPLRPGRPA